MIGRCGSRFNLSRSARSSSSAMKRDACRKIAWQVPVSSSPCAGTVRVWDPPSGGIRRSLTWLPRRECTAKPNRFKMAMTSAPESRRSLGIRWRQFQGHEDGRVGSQAQTREVLAFEVERDGFSEIRGDLVQGGALRHDGDFHALSDEAGLLARSDDRLDRPLESHGLRTLYA